METAGRPTSEKAPEERYFGFLADMGLTKHIGSMRATEELVALCHIGAEYAFCVNEQNQFAVRIASRRTYI